MSTTPKPSVLVAARFLPRLLGKLGDHYTLHGLDRPEPDAIPPDARDARAIITIGGLKSDASLMDALPKLGLIACYAPLRRATRLGAMEALRYE